MSDFQTELEALINRHSIENGSNTPDFILAAYMHECLQAFNRATGARELWYGRAPEPVTDGPEPPTEYGHPMFVADIGDPFP